MKLYYKINIKAPQSAVWEAISDPNLIVLWNPKCLECNAGKGPFVAGYRYEATFKLGNSPPRKTECIIEQYQPISLLTTKYYGYIFKYNGFVRETFHLSPAIFGSGTKLKQVVDFTNSGISIFWQGMMQVIAIVGFKAGQGPLDGIKELVESGNMK